MNENYVDILKISKALKTEKAYDKLLNGVDFPEDIKELDLQQLEDLSSEIRDFLIDNVAETGGHLASNLGVVELTLVLHKVFNTPEDKIVWDVGHQSYVHKILTGRKRYFNTLRQLDGISGFPKTAESIYDAFNTGHSSTSVSAALGMAKARDIKKEEHAVIAVIGDGALTGGMAFEALNDAGRSENNLIVILNDNEMSISRNVGGLSRYLSKIRTQPIYFKAREDFDHMLTKIPAIGKSASKAINKAKGSLKYLIMPGMLFEELGFKYIGPIDGHNIDELTKVLSRAKLLKGPVLIHVCTQKGKGYSFAEERPHEFHGISPFEVKTGELKAVKGATYSDVFGAELVRLGEEEPGLVAVTAAMPIGTGLDAFAKKYPGRSFDVGIAEQHAITFSAGLAQSGLKPVAAIYSSFLQRAYDQVVHDVALQNLHVVFAIDRAGIVGEDGETHQGIYDLSFLSHVPNMTVMAPCDYCEFRQMIDFAVKEFNGPIAIRYPRGSGKEILAGRQQLQYGRGVIIKPGNDVTIVAIGNMTERAVETAGILEKQGISCEIINARFAKPLDIELITASARKTGVVATLEDNTVCGGFGSSVLEALNKSGVKTEAGIFGFPDVPVIQGSKKVLYEKYRLDAVSLAQDIAGLLKKK